MIKNLTPFIAALIAGVLSSLVGWWLGRHSGKYVEIKRGEKDLRQARTQSQMLQRDLGDARRAQQRVIELLVNLPDAVNKIGSARSTQDLCRITARALMDYAGAQHMGLFLFDQGRQLFVLEVRAGGRPVQQEVAFSPGEGRLGRLSQLIGVREKSEVSSIQNAGLADELFAADLCVAMRRHEKTYAFVAMDGVVAADQMVRRVVQMISDVHAVSAEGVRALDAEREHLVFLLWGSNAQKKGSIVDRNRHFVLTAPHPSPLSAHRGFFGCAHFSSANRYLDAHGMTPINWFDVS